MHFPLTFSHLLDFIFWHYERVSSEQLLQFNPKNTTVRNQISFLYSEKYCDLVKMGSLLSCVALIMSMQEQESSWRPVIRPSRSKHSLAMIVSGNDWCASAELCFKSNVEKHLSFITGWGTQKLSAISFRNSFLLSLTPSNYRTNLYFMKIGQSVFVQCLHWNITLLICPVPVINLETVKSHCLFPPPPTEHIRNTNTLGCEVKTFGVTCRQRTSFAEQSTWKQRLKDCIWKGVIWKRTSENHMNGNMNNAFRVQK